MSYQPGVSEGIVGGRLFVVATPLGNLEDVSPRALRTLREVSLIACEDTRRTARLLRSFGVETPTTSCFEHNERDKIPRLLDMLRAGRDLALVTDAGTPAVSDPGQLLVQAAHELGARVIPIPGPSAVTAALSVAGLPCARFLFIGFLPAKAGARRRELEGLASMAETLVFFESPVRVVDALDDMIELLGDRDALLAREATKLYEEYRRACLSVLRSTLAERGPVKGEIVLVVAGSQGQPPGEAARTPEQLFAELVEQGQSRRTAVKATARALGLPAREVYRRVLDVTVGHAPEDSHEDED
jgi:16S rRNA (cytidine1402-2'-O)-methyltransferase